MLMNWREQDGGESELIRLLSFFVRITKQEKQAHVLLATSDSFLASWLERSAFTALLRWEQPRVPAVLVRWGWLLPLTYDLRSAEGIDKSQMAKRVIGNLPEEEARAFMYGDGAWPGLVKQYPGAPELTPELWAEVYAVCGGNPGLLEQSAEDAELFESWRECKLPA
jgi:hypothetical protein